MSHISFYRENLIAPKYHYRTIGCVIIQVLFPYMSANLWGCLRKSSDPHPTFKISCIPSSSLLWNSLSDDIKYAPSFLTFPNSLRNQMLNIPTVSAYFLQENRKLLILHARARNNCSDLNGDLYLNHLLVWVPRREPQKIVRTNVWYGFLLFTIPLTKN